MAKYKLGKKENGNQVVLKSGHVTEFYANALTDNIIKLRKMVKELKAQASYNAAEVKNLLHFNPWLKNMDDEKLKIGFLYERAMGTEQAAKDKLKEVEDVLEEELKAVEEVERDTKLKIPVPAPQEAIDKAAAKKEAKKDVK